MNKICIFAGTKEGRDLTDYLTDCKCSVTVCVATEYGKILLENKNANVIAQRMDINDMCQLFSREKFNIVVDATHPYAQLVTDNIISACSKTNTEYLRINREEKALSGFADIDAAIEYLNTTQGNILVTTGSKELYKFTAIDGYKERIFPRVLATERSIEQCRTHGFSTSHIIAMQGPFSHGLNVEMIKAFNIKYLVTKNSGETGGFEEKLSASKQTGVQCVVIDRPKQAQGVCYLQALKHITEKLNIRPLRKVFIVGIGTGDKDHMTVEAEKVVKNCQMIIGAKRLTDSCADYQKPTFNCISPQQIVQVIEENNQYNNICVVMSGDIGFYSGAKKLYNLLHGYEVLTVCGISSLVYFAAKLKLPWQDIQLCSLHGRNGNIIDSVKNNYRVFALVGGETGIQEVVKKLVHYNLGDTKLYIGENLSYQDEKITIARASELENTDFGSLTELIIENPNYMSKRQFGIPDEDFIRIEKIPMTKSEIRAVSLSKMQLCDNSVVYDIGAGTGSVSIEAAIHAYNGKVYAIEKNSLATQAIEQNKIKFMADNIEIIKGIAPQSLNELEKPTHAFIGGSSGNMEDIFACLFEKNEDIRIIINAIALETLAQVLSAVEKFKLKEVEIVQVNISKSKKVANYNMMTGQNPIYIITCQKGKTDNA